jgi:hypothetical protein
MPCLKSFWTLAVPGPPKGAIPFGCGMKTSCCSWFSLFASGSIPRGLPRGSLFSLHSLHFLLFKNEFHNLPVFFGASIKKIGVVCCDAENTEHDSQRPRRPCLKRSFLSVLSVSETYVLCVTTDFICFFASLRGLFCQAPRLRAAVVAQVVRLLASLGNQPADGSMARTEADLEVCATSLRYERGGA